MSKKTVSQIKLELDGYGVSYKASLRKAELLSLLQEHDSKVAEPVQEQFSPAYTRRRTIMATVELQPMTDNLLKLDPAPLNLENSPMKLDPTPLNLESPLNHASAVIEELVAESKSEHVSVDVQITKETLVSDTTIEEHVTTNGNSSETASLELSESDVDVLDDSDDEMLKEIEIDGVEVTPDTKHVTRAVTKRRSERMSSKHVGCNATLFSDDESPEIEVADDTVSTTSSEEERVSVRRRFLLRLFLFSLVVAVLSNLGVYLHQSFPHLLSSLTSSFNSVFSTSAESPAAQTPSPSPEAVPAQ